MANTSRPFGFRPERYFNGTPWSGKTSTYGFSSSQANNVYKGDVVQFDATNRTTSLVDAFIPLVPVLKPVVAAATTNLIRGVVVGFYAAPEYNMTATASLGQLYRPASTTGLYAWVVDDPFVVFEVEESGNSYVSTSNNAVGKVIDVVYTAGNQTSGIAKVKVDATTLSTSSVKPFRVLRYTARPDNFSFTASDTNSYAHLDVLMNSSDIFGSAISTTVGS